MASSAVAATADGEGASSPPARFLLTIAQPARGGAPAGPNGWARGLRAWPRKVHVSTAYPPFLTRFPILSQNGYGGARARASTSTHAKWCGSYLHGRKSCSPPACHGASRAPTWRAGRTSRTKQRNPP